jgi:hypothetical protein
MELLDTIAKEKSSFGITVVFTNELGVAMTPLTLTWSLTKVDGTVINSRDDVAATPGTSVTFYMSGDDLVVDEVEDFVRRVFTIKGTWDSTGKFGATAPFTFQWGFDIEAMVNVG